MIPLRSLTPVILLSALCWVAIPAGLRADAYLGGEATPQGPSPHRNGASSPRLPVKVLVIGDSLSFGPFGEDLERELSRRFGPKNVALFASCGSSPEHWIETGPTFVTRCGYRHSTPKGSMIEDFTELNGRVKRPKPVKTPKIPRILRQYAPETVLVQLGTNWMDSPPDNPSSEGENARSILREFLRELRDQPDPPTRIVWILPPESAKYPAATQDAVERWILAASAESGFATTRSREMTAPYVPGKTGTDGVHYSKEAARSWAERVFWSFYGIRS